HMPLLGAMAPRMARPGSRSPPLDINDTPTKIAHATDRLRSEMPGIPREAASAILDFVDDRRAAVSPQRILTYLGNLHSAANKLGTDFLTPTRDTPARFLRLYKDAAVWTQITVRSVLFSFWKWRFERAGQDFPSWLKIVISKRNVNHKDHGDVLTPEEVGRLAEHAVNLRDKALISTLYESGTRAGEILAMRVGDVERTDYGAIRLYLPTGKTGRRTVPLFEAAVPNLLLWLKNHPRRDDKEAPLWCGVQQTDRIGEAIGYRMAFKILRKAAERAGIRKPVNPHNFRHSRATAVAQNPQVSTSILEQFFGWQPGSPMAKTYVHLSGKEVEEALARAHGIEVGRTETPKASLPRVCARCSTSNDPDGKFCLQCGGPLSLEGVEEAERWKGEQEQLAALLDDPRVRTFLARRLKDQMAARGG
ncbi:MAG: tyrosine-type recombinase/integrase, partial [Thermoplasmata archaeon]